MQLIHQSIGYFRSKAIYGLNIGTKKSSMSRSND